MKIKKLNESDKNFINLSLGDVFIFENCPGIMYMKIASMKHKGKLKFAYVDLSSGIQYKVNDATSKNIVKKINGEFVC